MSDHVLLREAVRALQNVAAQHDLADTTERRVLSTLQQRTRRRRAARNLAYLLSCSLCVAASAHAAVHGPAQTWRMIRQLWRAPAVSGSPRPMPAPSRRAPSLERATRAPDLPVTPPTESPAQTVGSAQGGTTVEASTRPPTRVFSERRQRARAGKGADSREQPATPEPVSAPQRAPSPEALYNEAHQLHFMLGDKAAALRAWEAYLAAAPAGTYAPEAHYNRALCLIALGRSEDARVALRAIAAGELAGYRARDAARLLHVLEGR